MFHIILAKGKILTGNNKAWFGNSANKATELMTRADIQFKFLGYNSITKPADDTISKWVALGTGYATYTISNCLNNQPSQYGFLINIVDPNNVFQVWNTQGAGPVYARSGNQSGWNTNFHKIDASDALKLTGGTMTGQITFNASTADEFYPFKFALPSYNAFPLKFIKGDIYGVGLAIQSGGTIIVGGGEAATTLFSRFKEENANYNPSTEDAYLAADQTVWVCTNCKNPANRKTFKFDNGGSLTVPVNVTAAKFIGALQGNANTASTATKLATARSIRTNLASGSAVNFDGSANITPGITGILPVANGGTGNNAGNAASATKLQTARNIQVNLASTSAASFNGTGNATPGISGTLAVGHGGTGLTNLVNTAYTTQQVRGIAFATSTPRSVPNGEITLVYG